MRATIFQLKKRLEFRYPTEEELTQINQYRPRGTEPYVQQEVYTVPLLASNNLMHSSLAVWDKTALETMVASYLGKDLMMDHSWDDSLKDFGFVYDAELWHIPKPSNESISRILVESPSPDIDKEIIDRDGLYQVVCYAAIEASHPLVSEIKYRRKADVSIGGHFRGDYICPLCESSFSDEDCPHYPPVFPFTWFADPEDLAPYYIRAGEVVSLELSFVFSGNCVQAGIISENLNNIVLL
jgi:hypothetical protein